MTPPRHTQANAIPLPPFVSAAPARWFINPVGKKLATFLLCVLAVSISLKSAEARPIQLLPDSGGLRLDANLEISISDGAFFEPVSLSPDLYYGFASRLVFGLTHSAASQGYIGSGNSLRLTGGGDLYRNVGLEFFYKILNESTLGLAPQAGLIFDQFDPFLFSLKIGALAHAKLGPITVVTNPNISLAVNKSDERNNSFILPFWGYYTAIEGMDVYGYFAIDQFEAVGIGMGATFLAIPGVRLGAQLGWPRLVGENSAADRAHINLFAQFRL